VHKKLKVTAIGNSTGVILPKELLEKLRVGRGDELIATETPDGIVLSAYDATFAEQMDVAERVMRRRRNLLKKLGE
jgi:putative addiction module antidote